MSDPAGDSREDRGGRPSRRARRAAAEGGAPQASERRTPSSGTTSAAPAGPGPEAIARLEAAARHRATGGRLVSPDARRALCESCGSPEVDWGSLCRGCRDRLAGRRPPGRQGEAAPEAVTAPAGRREAPRTRRRQRPVDDELSPQPPVRSIISAQPGRAGPRPQTPPPAAVAPPSPAVDMLLAGLPGAVYRCEALPGRPIVFVAGSAAEVLGPSGASPAAGASLDGWVHPDDRDDVAQALAALTAGAPFSLEYRLSTDDGERWVQDRGRATAQAGRLWIDGVLVDATPERMVRQELARLALHDPLTGLPNRRAWTARASKSLVDSAENATPISVVVLDIDHFKRVNDTLGHGAGDRVLVELASALRPRCPSGGLLARLGGEEFALLAPGIAREQLREAAERVRAAAGSVVAEGIGPISLSAGAVTWAGGEDTEALLARADRALYRAKAAGRGRVALD